MSTPDKDREHLLGLLRVAKCPNCDGSGSYERIVGEHRCTREMAMDAGDPSLEGSVVEVERAQEQCQWCDERNALFAESNPAT